MQPPVQPSRVSIRHHPHPPLVPRLLGGAFGLASLVSAFFAIADDAWVAQVRGVGASALPAGTALQVVAQDFEDLNVKLQPTIERALTAQGYAVDPHAGLQLVYATEWSSETMGASSGEPAGGSEVGDISEEDAMVSEGADTGPHSAEFADVSPQVNVPLGKYRTAGLSQYGLSFVVGAAGQTPLWRGSVTAALPAQDPLPIAEAMVPMLVPSIGKTVEAEQSFPQ